MPSTGIKSPFQSSVSPSGCGLFSVCSSSSDAQSHRRFSPHRLFFVSNKHKVIPLLAVWQQGSPFNQEGRDHKHPPAGPGALLRFRTKLHAGKRVLLCSSSSFLFRDINVAKNSHQHLYRCAPYCTSTHILGCGKFERLEADEMKEKQDELCVWERIPHLILKETFNFRGLDVKKSLLEIISAKTVSVCF